MSGAGALGWPEANQRHLTAALAVVRAALAPAEQAGEAAGDEAAGGEAGGGADGLGPGEAGVREDGPPPALDTLCARFGLSPFERDVLLLAAGPELDAGFAEAVAAAQDAPSGRRPTFGLALAVLPGAHWSALSPDAPLRRWRMVELGGDSPTGGELRIDERILHFLAGVQHLDERLRGWIEPLPAPPEPSPSQVQLAERLAEAWSRASQEGRPPPVLELVGPDVAGRRAVAAGVCAAVGLGLVRLDASALPTGAAELDGLVRLWDRESALAGSALLVEHDDLGSDEPQREAVLGRLVDAVRGPLLLAGRERRRARSRAVLSFAVTPPGAGEQLAQWRSALGEAAFAELDGALEEVVAQFRLGAAPLAAAAAEILATPPEEEGGEPLPAVLWQACRRQARPSLGRLAERIEPLAGWGDIVLPERPLAVLREIAVHVRRRHQVYERWGFASRSNRGLGVAALFAGTSGTGKTMAAEVLAGELRLDLYRIDLSSVISKYIGETEKNLSRVFDAAEEGGAILLFDEADALFGKRSKVKDSHDRYANIEVSYLLQRMETYRGLSILTTNLRDALDTAFLRRLRFVVQFPFPDAAQRAEIWRRVFPRETPTEGLDSDTLARLNVPGGNIRNIALAAAFLAADEGTPVRMPHLLAAARGEYAKLEKPLAEAEIAGWPA